MSEQEFRWVYPCFTPAVGTLLQPTPKTFLNSTQSDTRGVIVFTDEDQLHRFFDRTQDQGERLAAITHSSASALIAFLLQLAQDDHKPVSHVLVDPSAPNTAMWRPIRDILLEAQRQAYNEN